MSAEVTVRPDGLISLPLLNEVQAGGLTPEQLRDKISKAAMKFLEEAPTLAIVVKAINSRKVYHHRHGRQTRPLPADRRDDGRAAAGDGRRRSRSSPTARTSRSSATRAGSRCPIRSTTRTSSSGRT